MTAPVALVLAMAVVTGCATKADADDPTGLLDIDGSQLYPKCRGSGSPTVFIIPGAATNITIRDALSTSNYTEPQCE